MSDFPEPRFDDEIERQQEAERLRREAHERKRAEFRAKFPKVTDFADELRALGLEPKIVWAIEDGNEVGPVPDNEREAHYNRQHAEPAPARIEAHTPTAYERAVAALQKEKPTRTKRRG